MIVIGAGGHGLATAYYLAKEHGITNVAVLERGWLGGGNIARNTVTVRSNYMRDASIPFYVKSVALYEGLTKDLNFNLMHSKRTMVDVVQTYPKMRELRRRQLTMDIYGSTYEQISEAEVRRRIPALTGGGPDARLPVIGGMVHTDAGVNRHDAVAWGYARAIDAMGVEIHQQTAVDSLIRGADGRIEGVQTNRGVIKADKVAVAVSGHTTTITETAGLALPLRTMNLTAFVSEPVKPLVDVIVNCPDAGFYFSQSDKGEMVIGGAPDPGQSFRRDIKQNVFEDTVSAMLSLFPSFKKLKLLRQWGGHLDIAQDASPIMDETEVPGLVHHRRLVGRLQGDPRRWPDTRPSRRHGCAASVDGTLHAEALPSPRLRDGNRHHDGPLGGRSHDDHPLPLLRRAKRRRIPIWRPGETRPPRPERGQRGGMDRLAHPGPEPPGPGQGTLVAREGLRHLVDDHPRHPHP